MDYKTPKHRRMYAIWYGMVARCTNENHKQYSEYGGRGIKLGTATTPPVLKLQGNYDGTASGWFDITDSAGAAVTLTGVASQFVTKTVPNVSVPLVRAIVSTVGATVVPDYVFVRAAGA